ncbi:MAG: N-acetylglucosamine-6-phosphate deacetylase [Lachnospiraceae bacterium]
MIIKGEKIYSKDGCFRKGQIQIQDGKIKKISFSETEDLSESTTEEVLDVRDQYVIPGLVDIHFHGCMGVDFCDGTKEAIDTIAAYELSCGITSMVPATMTLSREMLAQIFETAGNYQQTNGSRFCGITMEGPFVSMAKKGAQNAAYIHKPDVSFYRQMQELSGGKILQVAVAPEEDADDAFIKEVSKETVISVAHTVADYETAKHAFLHGANHVTHLFNAMPGFLHRDPGVVGAAAENKDVYVELICDGIHIHPSMVRAMFALFGSKRICMISDSMMATGMKDGEYSLGGQAVHVEGKRATLFDGTIAGSASNLMDCLRVAVKEMGIPLEDVVRSCTLTPATSLGIEKECGSLSEGKRADIVVLDKNLNLTMVIQEGTVM